VEQTRRRIWVLLVVALLGLATAWVTARPSVPLYDGVGFPDEPYRYVHPPQGYRHTPPPTKGTGSDTASRGTNDGPFYVDSAEQGPQVSVYIAPHATVAPAQATRIVVTATPLAPGKQPDKGRIDGNVYDVTARADTGGDVRLRHAGAGQTLGSVSMRATTARQPGPVFLYRPDTATAWRTLRTTRVGNDIYLADVVGFGNYALAFGAGTPVDRSTGTSSQSGSGFPVKTLLIVVLVVAVVVVIVAIRLSRSRQPS
jgi:hypothetical protein